MKLKNAVFLDPSYDLYHKNGMFDLSNKIFNRDDQLLPFVKVKEYFESKGVPTNTADYLLNNQICANKNYYYSFGSLTYKKLINREDINFKAFFIMEPVILAPHLYKLIPELTKIFEEVYVHNTEGKGYSLKDVDRSKLRKIYWPMPYDKVLADLWMKKDRKNKLVVINGNHNPKFRKPEFYSTRIKAMSALSKYDAIDLYGRGWKNWYSKQALWPTYYLYIRKILKIYKGECNSKYDVLSNYKFCLCFENTPMEGYISEKIFDCFYAGTIPVYLGDPKVNEYIPKECYINMREFDNYESMLDHIKNLTDEEINHMRNSAKNFMESKGKHIYTNFLINVFKQSGIVELKNN